MASSSGKHQQPKDPKDHSHHQLQPSQKKSFQTSAAANNKTTTHDHHGHVCLICADHRPKYWVVSECNHRFCWMCSLRLRVLYDKAECPMCKVAGLQAYMGPEAKEGEFEGLAKGKTVVSKALGYIFANERLKAEVEALLKISCPFSNCGMVFPSKAELKRHTSSAHTLLLCDICLAHKKVFTTEMLLFNPGSLQKHHRAEHPTCKLCGTFFFGDEELMTHYREKHERCHICYRNDPESSPYFRDYYSLESHFKKEHFLCPEKLCLEMKFVVFATEIEYKAHMAEVHLAHTKMQRSVQKSMTRIDASFMYDTVAQPQPSSSRSSNQPRTPLAPVQTERAPPATASPKPPSTPVVSVDTSKLFFGDSIGVLAGKLASLSLYQGRNDELMKTLQGEHLTGQAIAQLQGHCRRFQEGGLPAADLVSRVFNQLGVERAKTVFPMIIELQLDERKKVEMTAAYRTYLHKLEAFPPLPQTQSVSSVRTSAHPAANPPRIIRLAGPAPKPVRLVSGGAPFDPTKNPLGLIGGIGSAAKSTGTKPKKTVAPPGFSQAAAAGSGATMTLDTKPSASESGPSGLQHFDEEQFPSLLETSPKKQPVATPVPIGNAFAPDDSGARPDSFIIGQDAPVEDESAPAAGKKKKKKGQLVFRYG